MFRAIICRDLVAIRNIDTMPPTWTKLVSQSGVQRSSHSLSVVGGRAYVYGGELQPREPVDSSMLVVDLTPGKFAQSEGTLLRPDVFYVSRECFR